MILSLPEVQAQSGDPEITTRADQIQTERLQKNLPIQPVKPGGIRNSFSRIGNAITDSPIRILSGGLGTGAGIGVGLVLERKSYQDRVISRLWGVELLHNFYTVGTGVEITNLTRRNLSLAIAGSYSYAPQLDYYGPGPNSSIHNRTDYLKEDTLFGLRVALLAHRLTAEACRVGELLVNVGPGTNGSIPSTQTVFGPSQAPGIDMQSNYLIGGCSVEIDSRDYPDDPHAGSYAAVNFDRYYAQDNNVFSFNRLSAVGEHYIPFWNQKRVIALRANTILSLHSDDQVVPFYLQPTLGSDTELRGYRRYRFYDENSIALTAEYRWEISTGIDMALFADSGEVFHRPGEFTFSEMDGSAGFGFRFKYQRSVAARLDMGFSREGFQVWLKFGKLF